MTRRSSFPGLIAVAGLLLGVVGSLPAAAQDDPPPGVLLILDGSGSMNATDDAGRPLIDLAKEAMESIINLLPDAGVDVGLRVYGHRTSNTDEAVGCTDSELVVPVGPLDQGRMIGEINSIRPSGFTPIGLSLTEAAADLAAYETATVILVSDGEDTCAPPDPCEVAAGLVTEGITVNTVGFYLDDGSAARDQLECIADATGGSYRDADDDANLAGVVGVFLREVPGVGNFHIPLDGSADRATAPLIPLTPEDEFIALETTIATGEERWFAVDVPAGYVIDVFGDGRRFVEAAIPEPGDAVVVTVLDPDGRSVGVPGRFGRDRVDLAEFVAVGIGYLQTVSVETERRVASYDQFLEEDWMLEGLEYRGYDEASWNAELRRQVRYERRGPLPAGTYLIGIAWESELDAVATFDHLIGMRRVEAEWFSRPADLIGSTDPADPTPVGELPGYDSWPASDPELDPIHELYADGPIGPGETRWFSLDVEWDEIVLVDALLGVREGTPLPETDELVIEILDPLGDVATIPHPGGEPAAGTVGELTTFFGEGFEPRPLVSGAARGPGPDSPPPGTYRLGVTWDSVATTTDATLEVRIGTAMPDGMLEMPRAEPATTDSPRPDGPPGDPDAAAGRPQDGESASPDGSADAVDDTEEDGGMPVVLIIVIAALLAVGIAVATWVLHRHRRPAAS